MWLNEHKWLALAERLVAAIEAGKVTVRPGVAAKDSDVVERVLAALPAAMAKNQHGLGVAVSEKDLKL